MVKRSFSITKSCAKNGVNPSLSILKDVSEMAPRLSNVFMYVGVFIKTNIVTMIKTYIVFSYIIHLLDYVNSK